MESSHMGVCPSVVGRISSGTKRGAACREERAYPVPALCSHLRLFVRAKQSGQKKSFHDFFATTALPVVSPGVFPKHLTRKRLRTPMFAEGYFQSGEQLPSLSLDR